MTSHPAWPRTQDERLPTTSHLSPESRAHRSAAAVKAFTSCELARESAKRAATEHTSGQTGSARSCTTPATCMESTCMQWCVCGVVEHHDVKEKVRCDLSHVSRLSLAFLAFPLTFIAFFLVFLTCYVGRFYGADPATAGRTIVCPGLCTRRRGRRRQARRTRHDAHRPNENEERKNQEERERPQKNGPPTGSLILVSLCGVTVTANKLANLPSGFKSKKTSPDLKLLISMPRSARFAALVPRYLVPMMALALSLLLSMPTLSAAAPAE